MPTFAINHFNSALLLDQYAMLQRSCIVSNGYSIIDVDEFIAELWNVHLKVKKEGYVQVLLRLA
jgi:hypothetical protein